MWIFRIVQIIWLVFPFWNQKKHHLSYRCHAATHWSSRCHLRSPPPSDSFISWRKILQMPKLVIEFTNKNPLLRSQMTNVLRAFLILVNVIVQLLCRAHPVFLFINSSNFISFLGRSKDIVQVNTWIEHKLPRKFLIV